MRNMLIAALTLLSTTMPSFAQRFPAPPPPLPQTEEYFLACSPPIDRREFNPVIKIWVHWVVQPRTGQMAFMTVAHEFLRGGFARREDQYQQQVLFDGKIYGWTGPLLRDMRENMAGGAFIGANGEWAYRERHWIRGIADFDQTYPCEESYG